MQTTKDKHLFMLGTTHKTAPLRVRERFAINSLGQAHLSEAFKKIKGLHEWAFLNTCNRFEFYGVGDQAFDPETIIEALCAQMNLSENDFLPYAMGLSGFAALEHLFLVSCGADSQVLGEVEIVGQVKEAYKNAYQRGSTGPILNKAFQKAFQSTKWIRTHTHIGKGQVSVGSVATNLATRIFGNLDTVKILIVGSGEMGRKTLQTFKLKGANNITLTNRTFEKAQTLTLDLGGDVIDYQLFPTILQNYDVVICSTRADGIILNSKHAQQAMAKRQGLPMLLVDLAVPRNICESITRLPNVYLYNIDDLANMANSN